MKQPTPEHSTHTNQDPNSHLRNPSSVFIFALIISLFIGARVWRLTASCLWFDEIFSVHAAGYEWCRLLSFVAADVIHPPLFYALLKVWIAIGGESLLWLRLFPALISIAVVVPFFLLCRELNMRAAEIKLALLLLAVNGYLIKYAQEVRMYSLLLFFSVCSLWLFVRFSKAPARAKKHLLVLSAINLLLVYTHYYGWLVVAAEAALLLYSQRDKLLDFFIAAALLLLAFSPWAYAVTSLSEPGDLRQNIGWVARPRLLDIAQLFTLLSEPFYFRQSSNEPLFYRWSVFAGFLLIGLPLVVLLWQRFRQRDREPGPVDTVKSLLVFFLAPLILAFLLSWLLPHSIWGTRHLIILAVPYSLLAAIAVHHLRSLWIKTTVLILLGCWLFVGGSGFLLRPVPNYVWCVWEQLGRQVAQQSAAQGPVSIYAFEDLVAYHLWFVLRNEEGEQFKIGVLKGVPGLPEDPAYFLPRGFNDVTTMDYLRLEEEETWIAFRDLGWDEERPPLKNLSGMGYQIEQVLEASAGGQRAFLVKISRK